jgi:hypothetical protein
MILDLLAERLFAKLPAGGRERGVGPVGGRSCGRAVFARLPWNASFTLSTRLGQLWITNGPGDANLTIIRAGDPGSLPASSAVSPLSSGLSSHP